MHYFIKIFRPKKPIINRFFVFIAYLLALPTQAENLNLEQAIMQSLKQHPDLAIFEYQIRAQQGRVKQAQLASPATLNIGVENILGSGVLTGVNRAETTLSISWLLDSALRQSKTKFQQQGRALINNSKTLKLLDVAAQTSNYFLIALAHQEKLKIASAAINSAEAMLKATEVRVQAGRTADAELYRMQADLEKLRLNKFDLEHELKSALRQLSAQWGSDASIVESLAGELTAQTSIIKFEVLLTQLEKSPRLSSASIKHRLNNAAIALAKQEANSLWKVNAGIKRLEASDDFGFSVGVSIPLKRGNRNQGRIAELQAQGAASIAQFDADTLQMKTDLFIIYEKLRHNIHLVHAFEKKVIPALDKAFAYAKRAYKSGRYSHLELTTAHNELLQAQSALVDANLGAYLSRIELERLTGTTAVNTLTSGEDTHD